MSDGLPKSGNSISLSPVLLISKNNMRSTGLKYESIN